MKINCIIIEDEPKAARLLEEYIGRTPFLQLSAIFHEPLGALDWLNKPNEVDLIFLDISLPELTGMDLGRIIAPGIKIIFTTAHSDFAVKSYELNTVDYLLKPITYARFLQAATRVKALMEKEGGEESAKGGTQVFVKSGKKIIPLDWDDIYYIEALREYLSIVTSAQKVTVYKRMSEFERIQPKNFRRVHNSYIVNLDKIERVEDNLIHIAKREIPISRSYKDEFFAAIRDKLI